MGLDITSWPQTKQYLEQNIIYKIDCKIQYYTRNLI